MSDRIEAAERIADLLARFVVKSLKPNEAVELKGWVSENEVNKRLFVELTDVDNLERELYKRK